MPESSPNPPRHPEASPINGQVPPVEHRYKPGQSGNPKGRPTAGATMREWLNIFADANYTEDEIRAIARDKRAPWVKRSVAERILRSLEFGDLADFADLLRGEINLEELKAKGINTEVVKKFKQKSRRVPVEGGERGETEEVIEREIELHDRSRDDFDGIITHTELSPAEVEKNARLDSGKPTDRFASVEVFIPGISPEPAKPQ